MAAFPHTLGRGNSLDVKILVGLHGVIFAHSQGWTNFWIESDSKLAVRVFRSNFSNIPWRVRACWAKFVAIHPSFQLRVTHIQREGNTIVDMLAKLHYDIVWIGGCPAFLSDRRYSDMNRDYFRITD